MKDSVTRIYVRASESGLWNVVTLWKSGVRQVVDSLESEKAALTLAQEWRELHGIDHG